VVRYGTTFAYVSYHIYAPPISISPHTLYSSFAIYPLLKRVTYWPQAWLGFAMNFGFVVAWTAMTGSIDVGVDVTMMAGCWW
jgi:4-hydroxybenzoate polyprenyltransferase